MKRIGVICAMEKEYELLTSAFKGNDGIKFVLSGIGKVNAAASAQKLISEFHPDGLLSIGVAGTFVNGLKEGSVVVVSRCAYHDVWCGKGNAAGQVQGLPMYFNSDAAMLETIRECLPGARVGLLCTGDQFYVSEEEDARQKMLFPDALAIDMEGAAVAQTAFLNNIPFAAFKIISDNHTDGNQEERYGMFWNNLAKKSFDCTRTVLEKIMI